MEPDFWLNKWTRNEIGFHENRVHPLLQKHWHAVVEAYKRHRDTNGLEEQNATNVFVPLCGKSLDVLWLAEQGHHVFGVELSEIAIESLFTENGLEFEKSENENLTQYVGQHSGKDITIWCGDYFSLTSNILPSMHLFYDRAAFIALAPQTRNPYLDTLAGLLFEKAFGLMITLDYAEGMITPPPHSVTPSFVDSCCLKSFVSESLGRGDAEVKGRPCTEHALLLQTIS